MAIGVDIEDIERFKDKSQEFLDRIFTQNEQDYCLSKPCPQNHFAARFCAKEAVIKALSALNITHPRLNQIEVFHDENKFPRIKILDTKYANLTIDISLSHDKTKAIAFATITNNWC